MGHAYYNENDPKAAAWLRELIKGGHIAPGHVDERSIADVRASDLAGYRQCHFFAGIGGWSHALRLAGLPDDFPAWSGSCPCQPFSAAGKRKGTADARHLWPEFLRIISECAPAIVFGEQVASKDGRTWLSGVRLDLEALGYAVGAADLCAAGTGSPHIRQRLFWVADAARGGFGIDGGASRSCGHVDECGKAGRMADTGHVGTRGRHVAPESVEASERGESSQHIAADGVACGMAVPASVVGVGWLHEQERGSKGRAVDRGPGPRDFWSAFDLIPCRDGKARRVEPGTFPLADGVPARVGRLRGYGNAIVPQVAAEFVGSYLDVIESERAA